MDNVGGNANGRDVEENLGKLIDSRRLGQLDFVGSIKFNSFWFIKL